MKTVWIQIRPDILSGLIWVQTVCKDYQPTALAGKEFANWIKGLLCTSELTQTQ